MFENDHIEESDLMFRSILESGQEEVPEYLWKGIAEGLDKAARRRKAILWLGRSVAAAAAAVAVGIFFNHGGDESLVPESDGSMIAVLESMEVKNEDKHTAPLLAMVQEKASVHEDISVPHMPSSPVQHTCEPVKETATATEEVSQEEKAETLTKDSVQEYRNTIADNWVEEDDARKKNIRTSLVLSGIAGTNNPQNNKGAVPLRSPGILGTPTKTTIEQTSQDVAFGIPLSFGAGVKIQFNQKWSLATGINYSMLSSTFEGKYTKVENGLSEFPVYGKVSNRQHYIGIPVNAYYNILNGDFINFYAYAGGTVEKCVANRYEILTTPVINHSEAVKGVQLSANAGIGVEFMLGRYVGIYLDPSLRYYFHCKQPKSIRTAQPLMLGFEFGLRFNL